MEKEMLFEDMVKECVGNVVKDFMNQVDVNVGTTCELRSKTFLKNGNGLRIELVIKPKKGGAK